MHTVARATNKTYILTARPLQDWLTSTTRTWAVRDGHIDEPASSANQRNIAIDALVRSGDYFAELSTRLESLADSTDPVTAEAMHQIARELSYIERNYRIV